MVPEQGANDIWLQAATRPNAPLQRTECPECLGGMDAVLIPFRSRQVELDICRSCQRLWLDPQEHDVSEQLAIVPATSGPVAKSRSPGLPSVSRHNRADAMMHLLERDSERKEEGRQKGLEISGAIFGVAGGLVMYVIALKMMDMQEPDGFKFALGAGLLCYGARLWWGRFTGRGGAGE